MTGALDETVATLGQLIALPSVSSDSNLELIWYLAERLESAGARAEVMQDASGRKANLFATLGPQDAPGGLVLSGHTDVVPADGQDWRTDPFRMAEAEGRFYGRGSADMKGFIACAVAMAPHLAPYTGREPLHFAFTYDEEIGCFGAQALTGALKARGLRPAMAIVGEPTGMRVIDGHKGCCEYSTHFHGREGHGSDPDLGVNAVEYAARYVARLIALRGRLQRRAPLGGRFDPPWTTINVGRLDGGQAHNVIAGRARVDWEMRPVAQADADFVKADLDTFVATQLLPEMRLRAPEAEIVTEIVAEIAGLEPMDENRARALVCELTGANGADLVPFGTEAGLFQALGTHAVVCGPGFIEQAHKPDEYIDAEQLAACLAMLEALAPRLA